MHLLKRTVCVMSLALLACTYARADVITAPLALTNVEGNSASLFNIAATVQLQYTQAATGLSVGDVITGFAFRADASAGSSPALSFADFKVFLGPSAVATLDGNSSFTANQGAGTVQVRDGALSLAANSFPLGGEPNAFGLAITFNTPYIYTGGDLLLTYTKTDGGDTTLTDADVTANSNGVQLVFTDSYQATTVDPLNVYNPGSLPIQFQVTPSTVPEPPTTAMLIGMSVIGAMLVRRRQRLRS